MPRDRGYFEIDTHVPFADRDNETRIGILKIIDLLGGCVETYVHANGGLTVSMPKDLADRQALYTVMKRLGFKSEGHTSPHNPEYHSVVRFGLIDKFALKVVA